MTVINELEKIQNTQKKHYSITKFGLILFVAFFGTIFIWSMFTTLDGGSYAKGKVIVPDKTRIVQHLEGGTIVDLPVRNGDSVKAGDVVMVLSDVKAKSEYRRLMAQYWQDEVAKVRLIAERGLYKSQPIFSQYAPEEVRNLQMNIYNDNKVNYKGRIGLLKNKKETYLQEKKGLRRKSNALVKQVSLERKFLRNQRLLVKEGYSSISKVNAQEVRLNEFIKENADTQTQIAKIGRQITETDLEIESLKSDLIVRLGEELKTVGANLTDIQEKLVVVEDILNRSKITAPINGTVTNIKFNTIGGVVPPAVDILSIVPENTPMIVEAMVSPTDINNVSIGDKTEIIFTAYKSIHVPPIDGVITYISADTEEDKNTGAYYYIVQVTPDEKLLVDNKKIQLLPGMPAEVIIITGERSPIDYFLSPLRDSIRKSFIEE